MLNKYFTKKTAFLLLAAFFTNSNQSFCIVNALDSEHITQCLQRNLPHINFIPIEISAENYQQRALDLGKLNTFNKQVLDLMQDYSEKARIDKVGNTAAYGILSHFQEKYNKLRAESIQLTNEDFRWKFGALFCLPYRLTFYFQEDHEARKYNSDLFSIINKTNNQIVTERDSSAISIPIEPNSKNLLENDIHFVLNLFTLKYILDSHLKCGTFAVEFKLPLLVERLTTDTHFQNYLFTYLEHGWIEIEKSFDVYDDKTLQKIFAKKKTFLNPQKHHIIISAPYLRSTNLLSSLYDLCQHVFENLQELKIEFEKTQVQTSASTDQKLKSNGNKKTPKKKKKKNLNTLSDSTIMPRPQTQADSPILKSDAEKMDHVTLTSSSEIQQSELPVESDSQEKNSLDLTSRHEIQPLRTNTLSREKIDEAHAVPIGYQSAEMTDQEEGEWTTVGVGKKIPALKTRNPKDTGQKKNHTKKTEARKLATSIILSTKKMLPPQKDQVDKKRKDTISYAEVTASQQTPIKTEQKLLSDSSKDFHLTSPASETITQICDQHQQDEDSNTLNSDSLIITDSVSEDSHEPIEIKSVTLVEKSAETKDDILISSAESQLSSPSQNLITINHANKHSSTRPVYRAKKSFPRPAIPPVVNTVYVPYPIYVPVSVEYYPYNTVQSGYPSNGYCSDIACINGMAHFWIEKKTETSAYFQCETCSFIFQK